VLALGGIMGLPTIDKTALMRAIREDDLTYPCKSVPESKEELAQGALAIARAGFSRLTLQNIPIRKHIAYRASLVPDRLVIRCVNSAIRLCVNVQPPDRDIIIRRLATILAEGVPHRLYKFDIKRFYESIDTDELMRAIQLDRRIPRGIALLLSSYFDRIKELAITGIPLGIPLSATLAEYAMQEFDSYVSRRAEVYFYARYVDDIVIVTGTREDKRTFTREIARKLPFALRFNGSKTTFLDISSQAQPTLPTVIGNFDYLGYNYAVHELSRDNHKRLVRKVDVTIATKKLKRLKSRLCCAIAHYIATPDMPTLRRRLQLLTGNYNIRDYNTGKVRNVGLYCNYRRVNNVEGLKQLDGFFRSVIIGNRNKIARRFAGMATLEQRRSLLVFSFEKGFAQRTFYNFHPSEAASLSRCWRDA
jgi:hypothetical protein